MNPLDATVESPLAADVWADRYGIRWYSDPEPGVRDVARAMNAVGARFVTITAYQLPKEEGFRFEYHWDLAGRLLGFAFQIAGASIESIYDLCEGADWIEREVHEEYGIDFAGRVYEPLLLRAGETSGVNLREEVAR
jgi:NADH:ubiquinone oxidoreductase subunit C